MATLYSVTDARTAVADLLDDANNVRWSTTEIDRALTGALGLCVYDYAGAGGDMFTEEVTTTSSASDGTINVSTYTPLIVKSVQVKSGTLYYPIRATHRDDVERVDTTARDVVVRLVRRPDLPTSTSNPLVNYAGGSSSGLGSVESFDQWICVRAAIELATKDAEARPELRAVEADYRKSILAMPRIPQSRAFPRRRGWLSDLLRWDYDPSTMKARLSQSVF